ncbi:U3 snoRNP protein [Lobaria immixta]|nr:U3 snoRNP protein [Lobaria immixta]
MGLWMQYIDFARKQNSNKKLSVILTRMLQMHATKPELWIYAANYALKEWSEINEARSYMRRGLRFCKNSKHLWSEYARLEMIYIARIVARGRDLSREKDLSKKNVSPNADEQDANVIALSSITAIENTTLIRIVCAIPMAIFDGAIDQFAGDATLDETFFDIVVEFQDLSCASRILQHAMDYLLTAAPSDPTALICYIRQSVIGVQTLSAGFPGALGGLLDRLKLPSHWPIHLGRQMEPGALDLCFAKDSWNGYYKLL